MKINHRRNQIAIIFSFLITILAQEAGFAQTSDSVKLRINQVVRLGIGYQVQEFQLINQRTNSVCNCNESLNLVDRSTQTFNINMLIPFGDKWDKYRWALGFEFGYAKGRILNDQSIYTDAQSSSYKAELLYHLFSPLDRFRPYFTASAYSFSPVDQRIISYPVGIGLSFKRKGASFLRIQTTYDAGQSIDLAKNLITGVSLQFPLYKKNKSTPVTMGEKTSRPVVPSEPVQPLTPPVSEPKVAVRSEQPVQSAPSQAKVDTPNPTEIKPALNPSNSLAQATTPAAEVPKNQAPAAQPSTQAVPISTLFVEELNKVVYFDTDKSLLNKPGTDKTLAEVIAFMKKYPKSKATLTGHTDFRASVEYNMALSKRRVTAVFDYLVGKGIKPERIIKDYYGKSKPAASNDSDTGMASNRRVEIRIK